MLRFLENLWQKMYEVVNLKNIPFRCKGLPRSFFSIIIFGIKLLCFVGHSLGISEHGFLHILDSEMNSINTCISKNWWVLRGLPLNNEFPGTGGTCANEGPLLLELGFDVLCKFILLRLADAKQNRKRSSSLFLTMQILCNSLTETEIERIV